MKPLGAVERLDDQVVEGSSVDGNVEVGGKRHVVEVATCRGLFHTTFFLISGAQVHVVAEIGGHIGEESTGLSIIEQFV